MRTKAFPQQTNERHTRRTTQGTTMKVKLTRTPGEFEHKKFGRPILSHNTLVATAKILEHQNSEQSYSTLASDFERCTTRYGNVS